MKIIRKVKSNNTTFTPWPKGPWLCSFSLPIVKVRCVLAKVPRNKISLRSPGRMLENKFGFRQMFQIYDSSYQNSVKWHKKFYYLIWRIRRQKYKCMCNIFKLVLVWNCGITCSQLRIKYIVALGIITFFLTENDTLLINTGQCTLVQIEFILFRNCFFGANTRKS